MYISATGGYTVVSDPSKKHSMILKSGRDDKNYLERILKLPVYSFCYKDDDYINGKHTNAHFHNTVNIGIMYDDVEKLFNGGVLNKQKYHKDLKCADNCSECKDLSAGISGKGKGVEHH